LGNFLNEGLKVDSPYDNLLKDTNKCIWVSINLDISPSIKGIKNTVLPFYYQGERE
jgi:hypothetical protein